MRTLWLRLVLQEGQRHISKQSSYQSPCGLIRNGAHYSGYHNGNTRCFHPIRPCVKSSVKQVLPYQSILRTFHRSGRQDINPILWLIIKPVAKVSAALSGRQLRKWLKEQPADKRKIYHVKILQAFLGAAGVLAGFFTWHYYSNLQETPITKRERFLSLTPDQCIKVFEAEKESLLEEYKEKILPTSHPHYKKILNIARLLVSRNQDIEQMKSQNWIICIIDQPDINAFVLPTGHIFVFSGLIEFAQNDDQIAAILGHEMAHAILSHGAEKLSYTQLFDYTVILVMAAIWTIMPNDGISLVTQWFYHKVANISVHLPYNRKLEREADKVGIMLAAKACFDVREGSVFWTKMNMMKMAHEHVPEWLSTHPSDEKRVLLLDFLIPQALETRQLHTCPKLSDIDPRLAARHVKMLHDDNKTATLARRNLSKVERMAAVDDASSV